LIIPALAVHARCFIQTTTSLSVQLLPYLYLLVFGSLPSYYASDASALLLFADQSRCEYEQWLNARRAHATFTATPTASTDIPNVATDIHGSPPPQPTSFALAIPLDEQDSLPPSLIKVQEAWQDYIEAHLGEWKVLLKVAFVLLGFVPCPLLCVLLG
jgi:hypothetical protein